MPRPLPLVFTRAPARWAGYSVGQINRRIASGTWIALRRGVYAERARLHDPGPTADTAERLGHIAQIAAAVLAARRAVWVAGGSARFLHALPEAARPGDPVDLVAGERRGHLVRHEGFSVYPAAVPVSHRAKVHAIPTLTAARVAVDALRTEGLAEALMVGDAALRRGMADRFDLEQVVSDCAGWPGIVQARERLGYLDGSRETPLGSGSFALFVEHDLPLPQSQFEVWRAGSLLGRADFGWLEHRVLGEADGRTKYVDDLPGAPPPEERVWSERLRHSEFNDGGWEVARSTDSERRRSPMLVVRRILSAMERAEKLGLTR